MKKNMVRWKEAEALSTGELNPVLPPVHTYLDKGHRYGLEGCISKLQRNVSLDQQVTV
jgi:hypothetical protein